MTLENIFQDRPFKIRNADEYDISNILNLFVSPTEGLITPFDYENTIIKGRMGSGKTIYLRANHAFYLASLVPSLIDGNAELILPVFIRLNDFQHITKPEEIYRAIIIKIVEELTSIYLHLEDAKELSELHAGMRLLPDRFIKSHKLSASMKQLAKLGSDEYIERVTTELGLKSGTKTKFFELSAEWKNTNFAELKGKPNPGIKDVEECYKNLLENQNGKILLLIDEAGSLDKSFFKNNETAQCSFEILMNQFRTASFIRTKVAVYPNSYSDMLTETRYGDVIMLEDSVSDETGYRRYRDRSYHIIKNYLNPYSYEENTNKPEDIFELTKDGIYGDVLEQVMYASSGNMRRLIQLLDMVMNTAYSEHNCPVKVNKVHALNALKLHALKTESLFCDQDKELLNKITAVCKARSTCKFNYPNVPLYKYTGRSQEYNLINVEHLGSGKRSTVYSIDYAYAILKDLPTHRYEDSEKVYHERSMNSGKWISRVATINQEVIDHASLPGKIEGVFDYLGKGSGFVKSDSEEQFFFMQNDIIEVDKNKPIMQGKRVRFYPTNLGETKMAVLIEIL
ncbi:hypothetical protein HXX01_05055 [Candidatus Nomurabacteria bacterium]|nr:hypothetical protein [Candidatus Nomurabacteria bacterium]